MVQSQSTEAYKKLTAFVGTWIGDDSIHSTPWSPQGGTGRTVYTGRSALDGLFVLGDDVQQRPGQPDYLAHKVFGYDPQTGEYTFYLVDSTGQNPSVPARGKWEGNTVRFLQTVPNGHIHYRYTFDHETQYTFQMAFTADEQRWQAFIDGVYHRQ